MIKKFFGIFILILVMASALVAYSLTNTIASSDVQGAVTSYKQKLFAKTKEIAAPVLKKAGFDIEQANVNDLNIVERQMDNATGKVNEATQALKQ